MTQQNSCSIPQKKVLRVVVFISGRGSNLIALNEAIKKNNWPIEILAVISDKPSAAGLDYARSQSIPTHVVPRKAKTRSNEDFNRELAETAASYQPNLLILAGFMRIVSKELITKFPDRIINIHPSLLPSFPGLNAQAQALEAGVKFTGCTVHLVVEEVDAGPILGQAVVPVLPEDDESSLSARILKQEHLLLPAVVHGLLESEQGISHDKTQNCAAESFLNSHKPS